MAILITCMIIVFVVTLASFLSGTVITYKIITKTNLIELPKVSLKKIVLPDVYSPYAETMKQKSLEVNE